MQMFNFVVVYVARLLLESRKLLNHFGSTKINVLQYRDALVFVGQKGLTQGSAIEKVRLPHGLL